MVAKQADMKNVLDENKNKNIVAVIIKDEYVVTIDHIKTASNDDDTLLDITKADGTPVKTWTGAMEFLNEYFGLA